jgi:hypothetical protein
VEAAWRIAGLWTRLDDMVDGMEKSLLIPIVAQNCRKEIVFCKPRCKCFCEENEYAMDELTQQYESETYHPMVADAQNILRSAA